MNIPRVAFLLALVFFGVGLRAEIDLRNFDRSVDPANDFYRYANGTWLKNNPVPPEFPSWGGFTVLREENQQRLRVICERAAARSSGASAIEKIVGDFYASGMDEAAVAAAGILPLQPEFERIAAIEEPADVLRVLARLHAIGVGAGFVFRSGADNKDSRRELAQLRQGGLGLPERGYYFNDDEKSKKLRQQYVAHVAAMLRLLGDSPTVAETGAAAVLALETRLAEVSLSRVALRDPHASYHKTTVTAVAAQTGSLNWPDYFRALETPAFQELNLAHPEFFKGLAAQLSATSIADWKTYLRWHLVRAFAPYLSEPFVREDFAFNGTILTGTTEIRPRWKRVVATVDASIGEALGQLYVAEHFPPQSKARMLRLIADLRASLRERLTTLPWLDDATRARALIKLDAFTVKIGYPENWRDYSAAGIQRDSYVKNVMRANAFEVKRNLAKIGGAVDRSEWGMTPPTVNAYFRPTATEIVFPAGILQPPFFDPQVDDAVNYGAIGVVIGHELTHGFDDSGRQYDAQGNLTDWWTPGIAADFKARAARIVKQFSGYTVQEGLRVNGELTQGENIADLGGLKIAYGALQKAIAGKPRELRDGFTPEQRFFLSYATIWRINYRPEALRLQVLTNPHSPGEFRANGPLSNLEEFAAAFAIPEGAPMRRPAAERVEIW